MASIFKHSSLQIFSASAMALALVACKPGKPAADGTYAGSERAGQAAADDQRKEIADSDIVRVIERELQMDQAVNVARVDVASDGGVVTLSGVVPSLLAKDRATRVAELVRGVRSVSNQIEIEPRATRSDDELRADVKEALAEDSATRHYNVAVAVDSGAVTLSGRVPSWQAVELTGLVVKGVKGVLALDNELGFDDQRRDDDEIAAEIERRMRWDVLVDSGMLEVAVNDGAVHITGVAGSAGERSRAYEDAWVPGVRTVDVSQVEIERWARDPELRDDEFLARDDAEIERAVRDAATYDPRVRAESLAIQVSAGMIALRGTVPDLKARQAAEQLARSTAGVVDVKNYIEVRPGQPMANGELAERVHRALVRNPVTEGYEIEVEATKGRVLLHGTVDYFHERVEAEKVAASVEGVLEIVNQLEVEHTPHAFVFDPHMYPHHPNSSGKELVMVPNNRDASDRDLRDAIREELRWTPFLNGDDIRVSVLGGRVTLSGAVYSWTERRLATVNAFQGGAVAVINRLAVSPRRPLSPSSAPTAQLVATP
ncbi:BON domain-containing protein [Haliangium ochraceum]|uniref:Transport-associated n=1 Tax=Haliangium ochraceum (strain DSM 14365 / JCM 11303 / SMP-2) TaxID=502025 RepID=D0LT21_HALO1|nr:BON domain-containing protein [Haliangium ochraceum]ACY19157.1 transport-associated [Haliangium ochraceum DSM 14365]